MIRKTLGSCLVLWLLSLPFALGQQTSTEQLKREIEALRKRLDQLEAKLQRQQVVPAKAPRSVKAGFGDIEVGGLMQTWYTTDSKANDSYRLRRMEIKLSGQISPKVSWTSMFDTSKVLTLNTTTAGGAVTSVGVNNPKHILQDMHLDYALSPELRLTIGQFKVPMSREGLRSSSELLTVERCLFNTLPANAGRVSDIRDVGIQLSGKYPAGAFAVGIFDDGGARQNAQDDNAQKTFVGRLVRNVALTGDRSLQLGVYGATGKTGAGPAVRDRLGFELGYATGPHRVEAEAAATQDGTVKGRGGYLLYGYRFNDVWQAVVRYDQWDPDRSMTQDKERDYLIGVNYFLQGKHAKLQLNLVRKDREAASPFGSSRTLLLTNFQTAW